MKKLPAKILCVIVSLVAVYATVVLLNLRQEANPGDMGFITGDSKPDNTLSMLYSGLAMFAGILFGCFYNRFTTLQKQQVDTVNIGAETKFVFTSLNFYLALAASPVVFGIVIIVSKGISVGPGLFLAFQNGFFWQNVMPKNNMPVPVLPKPKPDENQ